MDRRRTLSGHSLALLDDFVGAREDRWWDGEAEFFRGREIDDQFDLARLQDRQIARLLARKNSARILSRDAVLLGHRRAVADQASGGRKRPMEIDRLQGVAGCEADKLVSSNEKIRIGG